MLDMDVVTYEMAQSRPIFNALSPTWPYLLRGKVMKYAKHAFYGLTGLRIGRAVQKGALPEEVIGNYLGGMATAKILSKPKETIKKAHIHARHIPDRDLWRKNGLGGRYWIYQPGRHQMVIVFHDANRAGPHIDIHIGRFSMIRRVKPDVYEQLRYNNQGMLTENSRKLLLDFLREEIDNGSRIPQNLDHSVANARASWTGGDPDGRNYGDGRTRQIVLEETVDVYKAHHSGPIEFYAPTLNPHRGMYVYKLHPGDDKRAPILVWGNLKPKIPALSDRLHLKLIHPEELDKLQRRADMSTSTAKYDGSSCYFVITKEGTHIWSPRLSKETGERIEYTFKLDGIANITADETIVGMGELLFKPKSRFPWSRDDYLPQAVGSGVLNSNMVLPDNVQPEIRVYRIDRIGRKSMIDLPFWENRNLQYLVESLAPEYFKVVELMMPDEAMQMGFEGVVAVPEDATINEGFKTKWWQDPHDWEVTSVEFEQGSKGGIAGVVRAVSLESGKTFKLGPGQVGDRALTEHMMLNPDDYIGRVMRVQSRHGHEGRASKVLDWHDDKGFGS